MPVQRGGTAAQDEENGKPPPDRRSFVDSAYRSLSSLSLNLTGSTWGTAGRRPTVSPTIGPNLLYFDLDPRSDELDHYNDIRPRLRARIAKIAKERHAKSCGIQAMMFGEVEAEAKLHVVVFCAPLMESAFNEMFASSPVQDLLGLPYTGRSLGFLVIPESPSPVAAYIDIDVCCQTRYTSKHRTYCGAPAIFRARHKTNGYCDTFRQGTIGGTIQVSYPDGKTRLYGMTAGHVPSALLGEAQPRSAEQDDAMQPDATLNILEWISDDSVLGTLIKTPELPEVIARHAEATHDWALIDVTYPQPNRAIPTMSAKDLETTNGHPILIAATPNAHAVIPDTVVLIGGTTGSRHGEFSRLPAEIWSENCGCFIDVYVLKLFDGKVSPGDSGAWVVHVANSELYGHVVATNALDQAYVVPVLDTFENMRACLGAISVDLPNARGLMKANSSSISSESLVKSHDTHQNNTKCTRPTIKAAKGRNPKPRKAFERLNITKRWDPVFRADRAFFDQPFVESLMQQGVKLDILAALLGEPSPEISRHEIERVEAYFQSSQERSSQPQARAWLSYEPTIKARHAERVTASELSLGLLASFASHQEHRNQCKAITLINPDIAYMLALIETVGWHQARALRNVLVKYIMSNTGIDIYIPTASFATFELTFHISYYTLRSATTDPHPLPAIALLSSSLHEAQVSLTVVGVSNNTWTSYCLMRVDDEIDLETEENSSDSEYSDDGLGWHGYDNRSEVISDIGTNKNGCKDPRKYWVEIVKARMHSVVKEWRHIVLTLKTAHQSVIALKHLSESQVHIQEHLEQISEFLCLLNKVLPHITYTTQAWSQFWKTEGSIVYFDDLDDKKTCATLKSIKELSDRLSSYQDELHRMGKTSEMMFKIIDRAFANLSLKISWESHELHRRTHALNLLTNNISHETARLNRQSTAAAVETSRTTRTNVQLFLIATPFILALQYFGAERDIFSFDRSPKSFVFGILILFCLLPTLTYVLGLINQSWDKFHRKLYERSEDTTELDEKFS